MSAPTTPAPALPAPIGPAAPRSYQSARVAVLANDPLTRAGLRGELTDKPGIVLVDDVASADVVIAVAESSLRELLTEPTHRLVLVADDPKKSDLWLAVERGLVVLVPRAEATALRLLKAVSDARRSRGDLPPAQLGLLLRAVYELHRDVLVPHDLRLSGLSRREIDILRLLADGLDTGRIAAQLSYSERTIKNVLSRLLTRLGLQNRTHAVAYALRNGMI